MYDERLPNPLEVVAVGPVQLAWQPDLLEDAPRLDWAFAGLRRLHLDAESWVDHCPGWLTGSDAVFAELAATADWTARTRVMYGDVVAEPRLTATWSPGSEPALLAVIREALSTRYGVAFDSVGVNLYRDGRDSVAWHRDRVHRALVEPTVGTVTLGASRRFALRPLGGGPAHSLQPHAGDLIVMGGRCQQDWEHTVPKCSTAGPRMAITIRHSRPAVGRMSGQVVTGNGPAASAGAPGGVGDQPGRPSR